MAQPLCAPADAIADGDVDAFVAVVVLLIGDVGDQLLVNAPPDVSEIDRLHAESPFPVAESAANPWRGRR